MSESEWPPQLTVEIEPVQQLFTGENFYSSADAALREAVLKPTSGIENLAFRFAPHRRRPCLSRLRPKPETGHSRSDSRV